MAREAADRRPARARVICWDGGGNVLAEGRAATAPHGRRLARWMLDHVAGAAGAAVPRWQYEVAR